MTQAIEPARNGVSAFRRLDVYAGGVAPEDARVDSLAVISCGYRAEPARGSDRPGLPRASRPNDPQQIHLHDPYNRAPGLAAALEDGAHRQLLIAFPLDDPRQFVIQRFTRYSATRLEAYGDETALTWIQPGENGKPPQHLRFEAGTPEYERLVRTCKADTRIYFCLAEWGDSGPEVVFPDGLGVYAIRTTSRHSVRSILGSLAYTAKFTRGHIAGLPFLLTVDHREVAGPDGTKRSIPVWTITTKPPAGARLSSRTFREIATTALKEGASLMLPAPAEPDFEADGPPDVDEPSEQEMAQLAAGGLCDYDFYIRAWHAMARGSAWDNEQARASFIGAYTKDRTTSLAEFLQSASEDDAASLVAALGAAVTNERRQRNAGRYKQIFGSETENGSTYDLPESQTRAAPVSSSTARSQPGRAAEAQPAEAAPPETDRQITSKTDPLWKEWLTLEAEARKAGVEFDTSDVKLGCTESSLRASMDTLREAIGSAPAESGPEF